MKDKKFKIWNIANTTTRRFETRLYPSLKALDNFIVPYGKPNKEIQKKFAKHLEKSIKSYNIGNRDDYDDLARKTIAGLKQFGLVFPNINRPKNQKWDLNKENQDNKLLEIINTSQIKIECKGRPWEITPLGRELLEAKNEYYTEKVFQKIFILYRLPSLLDKQLKCEKFNPFKLIIKTIKNLKYLSSFEFMMFILMNFKDDNILEIQEKINDYRDNFSKNKGREKKFAENYFLSKKMGTRKNFDTAESYVDTAYHYFKLTGIFHTKGKKIYLKESSQEFASQILSLIEDNNKLNDNQYLNKLWSGSLEIIVNKKSLNSSISSLNNFFKKIDAKVPIEIKNQENNENKLIELRNFQRNKTEELFYFKQSKEWMKVYQLLSDIRKNQINLNDRTIRRSPEIFEWATWRSLLAINNIVCSPGETRFFNIDINDEDLLPLDDSKSGYEDLFFQFEKYNLVVEVTYTESSRQDAAERYSVREHLVKRLNKNKETYALFIAPSLDLNVLTAYSDSYWLKGIKYDDLKIVPLSIEQYKNIFHKIMCTEKETKNIVLKNLFDECLFNRKKIEPDVWLNQIDKTISGFLN